MKSAAAGMKWDSLCELGDGLLEAQAGAELFLFHWAWVEDVIAIGPTETRIVITGREPLNVTVRAGRVMPVLMAAWCNSTERRALLPDLFARNAEGGSGGTP